MTVTSAVLGADFHTHGQPASHIASSIIVKFDSYIHVSDGLPKQNWDGADGWDEPYPVLFWIF